MPVSRQQTRPNHNQRNRTRAAIIEAATALMREGKPPSVAEAAERALVSRATAYRYFPTQESLLLDVARVEPFVKPVHDLVASFSTDDDAEQRLAALSARWPSAAVRRGIGPYRCPGIHGHVAGKPT